MKHLLAALLLTLLDTCGKPVSDPKQMPNLPELTITKIHTAYQAGHYTAEDLVTAYLARMDSLKQPADRYSVPRADVFGAYAGEALLWI